jgi:hypothetical protein
VIKSRIMRWVGNVARVGDRRGLYKDWWGDLKGIRQLERPRRRSEYNIKKRCSRNEMRGHELDWSGLR